ncbi:MAG TPA: MMPL family transporter, partial [Thermoleophilia bacterium]|nr:MMPL family transporter [Thermoleophilia bacterium]
MAKLPMTARLARLSARRPWLIISVWAAFLILAALAASTIGGVLGAEEMGFTNAPESVRGARLLEDRLRGVTPQTETIVIKSDAATVDDPAFRAVVERVTTDVSALDGAVASAFSYYQVKAVGAPQAEAMVSKDRHATIIQVALVDEAASGGSDRVERLQDALAGSASPGYQILTIGAASVTKDFTKTAESDLIKAEAFGLPVTLIVLVVVFGAVAAAGVSLLLALTAIVVAIGLTAVVGRVFELSFFVVNMVTMIGLAVGIDYALFIIERYREERRAGAGKHEAITIAGGTASNAVLFSGATVVLALLGLFIVPITTFRSLGIGAVLVVTVAVAAMLTLVPALLSLLGDRVDWPRIPSRLLAVREMRWGGWLRARAHRRRGRPEDHATEHSRWAFSGFWGGIAHIVMRRPIISVAVTVALLVAAAMPYADLRSGSAGAETLPPGDTKTAYTLLETEFPGGLSEPVEIVVAAERVTAVEESISALVKSLDSDPDFVPGARVEWNRAGDLALVSVQLAAEPNAPEALDAIARLRTQ